MLCLRQFFCFLVYYVSYIDIRNKQQKHYQVNDITNPIRHENGQLKNVDRAVVKIASSKLLFNQAPMIKKVIYLEINKLSLCSSVKQKYSSK